MKLARMALGAMALGTRGRGQCMDFLFVRFEYQRALLSGFNALVCQSQLPQLQVHAADDDTKVRCIDLTRGDEVVAAPSMHGIHRSLDDAALQ